MEPIPARILRRIAQSCPSAPPPTARQERTRAYIVEAATGMFADHGTSRVQLKNFAEGCGLSPSTIRRHVCDMHYLFRLVLAAHLDMLLAAISQIPDQPGHQARCRAEYHRLTRDHQNRLTPIHALLVRHRFALPDDQRDPIEDQRRRIGLILAGNDWESAFDLLDGAAIGIDRIEAKFAAEPGQRRPAAEPAAKPAAEAKPAPNLAQAQPAPSVTPPRGAPDAQSTASRQAILAATSLASLPVQSWTTSNGKTPLRSAVHAAQGRQPQPGLAGLAALVSRNAGQVRSSQSADIRQHATPKNSQATPGRIAAASGP